MSCKTFSDLYSGQELYRLRTDSGKTEDNRVPGPSSLTEKSLPEAVLTSCSLTYYHQGSDTSVPSSALTSSFTEGGSVIDPLSELYIFESETQEFPPSTQNPHVDTQGSYASSPSFPRRLDSSDTRVLSHHSSAEEAAQSHQHLIIKADSNLTNWTLNDGDDSASGEAETSPLNSQARQSDSPTDLWMDACQYLSGEDKWCRNDGWQSILWGDSAVRGELWAVSDLSCPAGDTGSWARSPLERLSSVDSWESALSDWAAIIAGPPEEITAAFTEIGAEIDALTQALADSETCVEIIETPRRITSQEDKLTGEGQAESGFHSQTPWMMAIQDRSLEPQPMPESSLTYEGSGLSISPTEPTELTAKNELQDTKAAQLEDSNETTGEEKKHPGETRRSPSSLTVSCAALTSPGEGGSDNSTVDPVPGSPRSGLDAFATDLLELSGCVDPMDGDSNTSNNEDVVLLHIEEDVDEDLEKENTPCELKIEEPFNDVVCEVTEGDEDLVVKEEASSYEPALTRPHPPPSESQTPTVKSERADETRRPEDLRFSIPQAQRSAHVPADTNTGPPGDAAKHVSHETLLDDVRQNELASGGHTGVVTPTAPLAPGAPLLCLTSALEGDQDRAEEVLNDNKGLSCPDSVTCGPLPALDVSNTSPLGGRERKPSKNQTEQSNSDEIFSPRKLTQVVPLSSDDDPSHRLFHLRGHAEDDGGVTAESQANAQEVSRPSRELSHPLAIPGDHLQLCPKGRIAYLTLNLSDPLFPTAADALDPGLQSEREGDNKMPHKTHSRSNLDFKSRLKKDKSTGLHPNTQTCKRQENAPQLGALHQATKVHDNHTKHDTLTGAKGSEEGSLTMTNAAVTCETNAAVMCETNAAVMCEAVSTKSHGKKKKKHTQKVTAAKSDVVLEQQTVKEESGEKPNTMKGKIDVFEAKLGIKAGKTKDKLSSISSRMESVQVDSVHQKSQHPPAKSCPVKEPPGGGIHKELHSTKTDNQSNDDVVKRRRLSENKSGKTVSAVESKLTKTKVSAEPEREEPGVAVDTTRKKAYSEVVKQRTPKEEPKVVTAIQAESIIGDPQSLCLWCQFGAVFTDHTVSWSREGATLAELKRSAGDESRVSVTISKASHKDLGQYKCLLTSRHGSVTLDYVLTYAVLSEIVVLSTPKTLPPPVEIVGNEEDIHCSRLLFREDFLSEQYFGENEPASIVAEAAHFGEGMHRRAFRTELRAGLVPLLSPGHTCVLKVHNSISYGTKNDEELIQKNFNLAVEECQVQNTAREYIKAYTTVANSSEAFGEVPEIIPIYLVHRPSSDIPYATLEEELIGDFVKYSVRDGKEINLMRRDSEAGQKCCAFQHWVYDKTDGNLLVTDMQGVGMRLTDVGIATCKKGYKGFRGNCATSFIDQFKALHQCNKYCELLSLKSLQPKVKKPVSAPKTKPQSSTTAKKKTFGPTVKGKS